MPNIWACFPNLSKHYPKINKICACLADSAQLIGLLQDFAGSHLQNRSEKPEFQSRYDGLTGQEHAHRRGSHDGGGDPAEDDQGLRGGEIAHHLLF